MSIVARMRQHWKNLGRDRKRPRPCVPGVSALEDRTLQAVNGSLGFVHAIPSVLPPSGKYVTVTVDGQIGSSSPTAPSAFYFVTDEYRINEPRGKVGPLTLDHTKDVPNGPVKTWYVFNYSFTLKLLAKRSTNTPDGRHYSLFVGATDNSGTDGLTTQIFVPKVYGPRVAARVAAAQGKTS